MMSEHEFERLLYVLRESEMRISSRVSTIEAQIKALDHKISKAGIVATSIGAGLASFVMYLVEKM